MEKIIKSIILSALFLTLAGMGTVWAEEALSDLSMESALPRSFLWMANLKYLEE